MAYTIVALQSSHATEMLPRVMALMEDSFPPAERRSREHFLHIVAEEPRFKVWVIQEENELLGFITTWQLDHCYYGEHFAVYPELRNRGIGRWVLSQLPKMLPPDLPFVFEVEPPTDYWSIKRLAFYQSLGMYILTKTYQQPAYAPDLPQVPMYLMGNHSALAKEPSLYIRQLYKYVYGVS